MKIDEKKQIDDMADVIFEESPIPSVWRSDAVKIAEALYSEGYRKQKVGEWESFPSIGINYRCSICKGKAENKSNFCPNCGAWMEGRNNNGC